MVLTYYTYFEPQVSVLEVVDDFGNVVSLIGLADSVVKAYRAFTQAKIFVYGLSFEELRYGTLEPVHEGH